MYLSEYRFTLSLVNGTRVSDEHPIADLETAVIRLIDIPFELNDERHGTAEVWNGDDYLGLIIRERIAGG
jgi:hypothetical protein